MDPYEEKHRRFTAELDEAAKGIERVISAYTADGDVEDIKSTRCWSMLQETLADMHRAWLAMRYGNPMADGQLLVELLAVLKEAPVRLEDAFSEIRDAREDQLAWEKWKAERMRACSALVVADGRIDPEPGQTEPGRQPRPGGPEQTGGG